MPTESDLKVLQDFVGSSHHQVLLAHVRQKLHALIAGILGEPINSPRITELQAKAKLTLEILTELRLDTIDLDVLSAESVSQFESSLPQRADFTERYREMRDDSQAL